MQVGKLNRVDHFHFPIQGLFSSQTYNSSLDNNNDIEVVLLFHWIIEEEAGTQFDGYFLGTATKGSKFPTDND